MATPLELQPACADLRTYRNRLAQLLGLGARCARQLGRLDAPQAVWWRLRRPLSGHGVRLAWTQPSPAERDGPLLKRSLRRDPRMLLRTALTPALSALFVLVGGTAQAHVSSLRWQRPVAVDRQGGGLRAISCPSVRLCVAIDAQGYVVTSTAPAGQVSAWRRTSARLDLSSSDPVPSAIDCPSMRLCVVADDHDLFVSSKPQGGAYSWSSVSIDPGAGVTSVSCPSRSLCVAVDDRGDVLATTTPTGAASAWSSARVDPAADHELRLIQAVSCPSTAFCVAADEQDNVLISSDPAGVAATWRIVPVPVDAVEGGELADVSCPSSHLCVAVDGGSGEILSSTDPSGPSKAWRIGARISPAGEENDEGSLDFVYCAFTTLCIAADNLGHVYTSTHPTAGAWAWSATAFELADVSCPSKSMCVAVQGDGSVRIGRGTRSRPS